MRKVLKSLALSALLLATVGVAAFVAFSHAMSRRAESIVSRTFVESVDSVSELAARKVVWRVFRTETSVSRDVVCDTVYTMKVGYDLADDVKWIVDEGARTVRVVLPPPKIMSIDHVLHREVAERKTFFARVFGDGAKPGDEDEKDMIQLADDCERYGLLDEDEMRRSLESALGRELSDRAGYVLKLEERGVRTVREMFNAYFTEQGADFRL